MTDKLQELSNRREHLFKLLQERKSLGAFDTNAPVIVEILQALVDLTGYVVSEIEPKKRPK